MYLAVGSSSNIEENAHEGSNTIAITTNKQVKLPLCFINHNAMKTHPVLKHAPRHEDV
jgi:hypothetical protein